MARQQSGSCVCVSKRVCCLCLCVWVCVCKDRQTSKHKVRSRHKQRSWQELVPHELCLLHLDLCCVVVVVVVVVRRAAAAKLLLFATSSSTDASGSFVSSSSLSSLQGIFAVELDQRLTNRAHTLPCSPGRMWPYNQLLPALLLVDCFLLAALLVILFARIKSFDGQQLTHVERLSYNKFKEKKREKEKTKRGVCKFHIFLCNFI